MPYLPWMIAVAMFLFPAADETRNPWKKKVEPAFKKAQADPNPDNLIAALDAAWRGDDFRTGLKIIKLAGEGRSTDSELVSYVTRALWRAGRLLDAEKLAQGIKLESADRVALGGVIGMSLARGDVACAAAAADRLEKLKNLTATEMGDILAARLAQKKTGSLADLTHRIAKAIDPENGYPETHMAESVEGLSEFFDRAGQEPLNQIAAFGDSELPITPLINLPSAMVFINGKGPYRLIVDTGGSITLSIDSAIARDVGLEKYAGGSVRGVGGKDQAWQTLVNELQIGGIRCKRVMTRVFEVRKSTMNAADGIIGTGIFEDARMTLDFTGPRLIVEPSSDKPGLGKEAQVRVIGDSKLLTPVTVNGEPATGLMDSGADAIALSPKRLKQMFPDRDVRTFQVGVAGVGSDAMPNISMLPGVDLVFAGRTYENTGGVGLDVLDTVLSTFVGVQSDVLIGMPVFRDMQRFTIDFPKRRMWVEWLAAD